MIFNVGVPAVSMASGVFQNNGTKSIALVVIFLFSLWTPFFSVQNPETPFEDASRRGFSGPFHLESGYGHDTERIE